MGKGNVLAADNKDKKYIYNMMKDVELVQSVVAEQDILIKEEKLQVLTAYINHLLNNDFETLVNALYRIDVEENKLKAMLQNNAGQDAARIIAQLMVERQQQKLLSKKNSETGQDIPEEEKW